MTTLVADSTGSISGQFTIPANIPAGAKAVQAVGQGGSNASATFTGRGVITVDERRVVNTISTVFYSVDPLAQTFTMSESRHVAGTDLWFTAKDSADVVVQIRDTVNGFPGRSVLAEKTLKAADLLVDGSSTRVLFPAPVWLNGGQEYALVVLTDSAVTALAVAELGKFDSNAQKWITSQPYQVGVLLSSSNASTWTAHQDRDMAFRLLGAKFTSTTKTVSLGSLAVTNATDLLALANVEIPATGANAELQATAPDGTIYRMGPGMPLNLPAGITGSLALALKLTGTDKASPVVYPGIQLAVGTIHLSDTYVSRAFACGSVARISVTFEAYLPGTSSVVVEIQKSDGSWQTLTLTGGTDVGSGWVERRYVLTGFAGGATTRVRLTPTGTAQYRPKVRQLRAVATD